MAFSVVTQQIFNTTGSNYPIDSRVYKAAVCPQGKVESSILQENLYRLTPGVQNTVLHLASAAENVQLIQQILSLNPQNCFIEAANVHGNTALHEAAQRGHYEVVKELLLRRSTLVDMHNKQNQTPLFKACEGGNLDVVKKLLKANPSKLLERSSDGRTCLHVVVSSGDAGQCVYFATF